MPELADPRLQREARAFCSYLVGLRAPAYVTEKYAAYHETRGAMDAAAAGAFDRALLGLARVGGPATRVADVYAARFAKTSLLTRKLIVMVAILECSPTTFEFFDRPFRGGRALTWLRLLGRGAAEALWLAAAVVLLAPLHALLALGGRPRGRKAA